MNSPNQNKTTDQADQVQEAKRKVIRSLSFAELDHAVMKWLSIYEPDVAGKAKSLNYGVRLRFEDDGSLSWDIHVPSES